MKGVHVPTALLALDIAKLLINSGVNLVDEEDREKAKENPFKEEIKQRLKLLTINGVKSSMAKAHILLNEEVSKADENMMKWLLYKDQILNPIHKQTRKNASILVSRAIYFVMCVIFRNRFNRFLWQSNAHWRGTLVRDGSDCSATNFITSGAVSLKTYISIIMASAEEIDTEYSRNISCNDFTEILIVDEDKKMVCRIMPDFDNGKTSPTVTLGGAWRNLTKFIINMGVANIRYIDNYCLLWSPNTIWDKVCLTLSYISSLTPFHKENFSVVSVVWGINLDELLEELPVRKMNVLLFWERNVVLRRIIQNIKDSNKQYPTNEQIQSIMEIFVVCGQRVK